MVAGSSHNEINTEQPICTNGVVVSVIVPVYNVEDYLEQCLESVISQTFGNIEIICVDDGSTDRSGEILEKFAEADSRIIVIHKKNGGLSSARNAALSRVKGKYICFVDSDDWLESNAVKEMVSHMTDEIDIVVAGSYIDDKAGVSAESIEKIKNKYTAKLSGSFSLDDNFINRVTVVVWSKLFKFEIIKKYGLLFLDGHTLFILKDLFL